LGARPAWEWAGKGNRILAIRANEGFEEKGENCNKPEEKEKLAFH
jgi:hypothetical protein